MQARDDGDLGWGGSCGGSDEWSDPREFWGHSHLAFLKVHVGCVREREGPR